MPCKYRARQSPLVRSLIDNFAALASLHCARAIAEGRHCSYIDTRVSYAKRFARVDFVMSNGQVTGKYLVDLKTLVIHGIAGYGRPHKSYTYGTVTECGEWEWSGHFGVRLPKHVHDAALLEVAVS